MNDALGGGLIAWTRKPIYLHNPACKERKRQGSLGEGRSLAVLGQGLAKGHFRVQHHNQAQMLELAGDVYRPPPIAIPCQSHVSCVRQAQLQGREVRPGLGVWLFRQVEPDCL